MYWYSVIYRTAWLLRICAQALLLKDLPELSQPGYTLQEFMGLESPLQQGNTFDQRPWRHWATVQRSVAAEWGHGCWDG